MDVASLLALITIMAQAVERIVELVSEFSLWGDPDSKDPKITHRRAIRLWFVSSALGIGACILFQIDFFSILNSQQFAAAGGALRKVMSGLIVGSGTKPVHDLLVSLEKYSRKQ